MVSFRWSGLVIVLMGIDPLPVVDGIEVTKVICRVFLRIDSELDLLCF